MIVVSLQHGTLQRFSTLKRGWLMFPVAVVCRAGIDGVAALTTKDHLDGTEDTNKLVCREGFSKTGTSRDIDGSNVPPNNFLTLL